MKRFIFILLLFAVPSFAQTKLGVNHGGTGQNALTAHYLLVGAGTSPITLLSPSTSGYVLTSNGTGSDPSFQLFTALTNPMTTLGDIIYENATPAAARLAGNTNNYIKFLSSTATTGTAQAPAWSTFVTDYGLANSAFINASSGAANSGGSNIGIGPSTFASANSSAIGDVAIGPSSLQSITSSTHDVAVGTSALAALVTNADCTAVGWNALTAATGAQNTAFGSGALVANTSGARNFAAGFDAGNAVTTNSDNTFVGTNAGKTITGKQNVDIGSGTNNGYTAIDNSTIVGYNSMAGALSTVVGEGTNAGGYSNVAAMGAAITVSAGDAAALGYHSTVNSYSTALGEYASANTFECISLGYASGNVNGPPQFAMGIGQNDDASAHAPVKVIYWPDGYESKSGTTPDDGHLEISLALGTNVTGGNMYLDAGTSTGYKPSGSIIFRSAISGSSGSTQNSLTTIHTDDTSGEILRFDTVTVSANAGTCDGRAEFYIIHSNAGTSVAVTGPPGIEGRIIIIKNADATAATTGLVVSAGAAQSFIYDGSNWIPY